MSILSIIMSNKKPGTEFEELAKEIFDIISQKESTTSIEGPKVFLHGEDGKREFDLVIRSVSAGLDFLTVVECRDHNKKLDVSHIDGFHSKLKDVQANKGVLISRKGFSKRAIKKAKRKGISLYIGHDSKQISDDLTQLGFGISIVVHNINEVDLGPIKLSAKLVAGDAYPRDMINHINDKSIDENLRSALFDGSIKAEITDEFQIWNPMQHLDEVFIRNMKGEKTSVLKVNVPFKITKMSTYWGYFHQLPNTKKLVSILDGTQHLIFEADDFNDGNYKEVFQKIDNPADVPSSYLIALVSEFGIETSGKPIISGPLGDIP